MGRRSGWPSWRRCARPEGALPEPSFIHRHMNTVAQLADLVGDILVCGDALPKLTMPCARNWHPLLTLMCSIRRPGEAGRG